ncbi:MAG: hypothetical protein WCA85_13550 [Paraburkholderia sp.]|uniref:hypothetical protein n=1 Tax=Paraburkholderia sp. TaxID=1926495 RepID=UPI003C674A92
MEKRIMHLSSPARLLHRAMFEWGDSLALFNLAGAKFWYWDSNLRRLLSEWQRCAHSGNAVLLNCD